VIAVIAILAAVLIPTFSGIVKKANDSAALQTATSTMKATLAMSEGGTIADGTYFVVEAMGNTGYQFQYKNNAIGQIDAIDTVTFADDNASVTAGTAYNAIIINKELISGGKIASNETVAKIIKAALGIAGNDDISLTSAPAGSLYSYTVSDGTHNWRVYTSTDYAKDIVVFTYSK
ncbi:MAG: hypothetical protein J5760_02965, partial [Clostridia bacterium]|nr:hypothetical protein [Clostridia bacterium]